jgi:hypothetical protein
VPKVGDRVRVKQGFKRGGEVHEIAEISPVNRYDRIARFACDPPNSEALWYQINQLDPTAPSPPPSSGVDVPRARVNPDELTILLAQKQQPWSVPYGAHKWWVTNNEGRLKHCLAHAQKTLGKIAEIAERLDHADRQWLLDEECDAVGDMAADLVSVALRLGTTVSRSVAHALVRRVTAKNGVALDPKGGTYGRALICT